MIFWGRGRKEKGERREKGGRREEHTKVRACCFLFNSSLSSIAMTSTSWVHNIFVIEFSEREREKEGEQERITKEKEEGRRQEEEGGGPYQSPRLLLSI
jgi:hypothetical protein